MATESKFTLTLTAVVVQDPVSNGFTGYMLEIPEAIAEGNTTEEVEKALLQNLQTVFEFKREDFENDGPKNKPKFFTKSIELEKA